MPKKLAICKMGSNEIIAVSKINGLTESTVNKVIENIHVQSAQLTQIRNFYDEFKYFKTLNFEINLLINDIKKDPNKIYEIQHLSRLLARYSYAFRDFVTFSDQYVVKHNSANLKKT